MMDRKLPPPGALNIKAQPAFKPSLIVTLLAATFSPFALADYVYDKDNPLGEANSLLIYENPVTAKQFTFDTTGFEATDHKGVNVGLTDNAQVINSLFTFNVGSSVEVGIAVAVGDMYAGPVVNGFVFSGNRMNVQGNIASSYSNRLQMVNAYKVNNLDIRSNQMLVSELKSDGVTNLVSATYTTGIIQDNWLSIADSELKNIAGISGSNLSNTEENSPKITNNHVIITDSSFNEVRGASISGAKYDALLDGNTLTLINPTVNCRFGVSTIIAQEFANGSTTNDVTNGVLFVTGKLQVLAGSNQTTEIGAAYSRASGVRNNKLVFKDLEAEFGDQVIQWETYGGWADSAGDAEKNSVTFDNARFSGGKFIYGGLAKNGLSNENGVVIKNGSRVSGKIIGASSGGEKVTNAYVTIDNSTVIGTVSIFSGSRSKTKYGSGTLSVSGASDLSQAVLQPYNLDRFNNTDTGLKGYSGETDVTFIADAFSGSIKQLGNVKEKDAAFDHVSLLNQQWDRDGAILSISDTAAFKKSSLTDNSLSFTDAEAVAKGGTITLIEAGNGITYVDPDEANQKELVSTAGTALEFTGKVNFDDQKITYTIDSVESAEQTILVGDSRLAAAAFVNQGSDLLERVFHGFTLSRDKYGLMTFATAEGTKGDYDLSNPIDVNGWNFIAGARSVSAVNSGDLTSAVFVEYGEGNYRTTNSHLGHDFRTDGDMQYMGAGVAVRLMTPSDFYVEGSLRAGQLKSDLDRALMDASGHFYDADTKSIYAGVHLGAGFIAQPIAGMELDSYAKYFFTYTDSDSFKIDSLNETYEFDSISSHRLRLGSRASINRDNVTFMFGLAGEYEFDAQSDMIAAGAPARTSELDGFSAFAEAGMSLKPSAASPWQFDLQVRGWEGTRDAVSGMATVNYLF